MLAIPVFISLEACFVTLPTLSFLESLLLIRPEFSHLRTFSRIPGISLLAGYLRQGSFVFLELILFVLMAWLQFNLGEPWRFMVAVLSISLPRDKLFDLQKMRYKGYLLAFLLTCFVGLFPTNALPVAGKIVFFCSCFLLILLFKNKYIRAAIITLLSCHLLAIF